MLTAIGTIRKLDAGQLKELLQQKDIAYLNKNQAQLEAMNIEAATFGYEHVPLSWLPKGVSVLGDPALNRNADLEKMKGC